MKVIHVYDGHERVYPGEGSVPSVVYQLARATAELGHDLTVLERRWEGTDYEEEINGIKFVRFDLNICSNVSNEEIVYEQIRSPKGVLRLISDEPLKEDVRPGPMDIYGKTKLVGEDIVKLMNKNAVIARIFNVYGPNDTNPISFLKW